MADVVVCRCEEVSLATVLAALQQGAASLDEVKQVTRAGMGACQGRTCLPLLRAVLSQATGRAPSAPAAAAPTSAAPPASPTSRWPVRLVRLDDLTGRLPPRPADLLTLLDLDLELGAVGTPGAVAALDAVAARGARGAPAIHRSGEPAPAAGSPARRGADVIIIGAGIVGCAAAYYLARAGVRPVVLEARAVGWAASGRNAGAIRRHGRHQLELPLAVAALDLWRQFARETPVDFHFRQRGDLIVAMTDAEEARLEASTALYRELGLEVRLLGRREARAMVPPLSGAVRAAAYCPDDAAAYPQWAVRAFARAARDRGARFVTGTRVEGVLRGAGRVLGVFAGGRTWRADSVVVAAGPWSAEVGAAAGLNVPVLPRRSQIMVTERTAPVLEPFLSGNGVYCRQSPFGHLLIGGGGPWERTDFDTANAVPTLRRLATRFLELFPGLGQLRLLRAWAGTVEITPDHLPILGPAPGLDGLVLACGFSGNGFAVGPAAGRAVADLIIHGQARWDLTPFRPDRFPGDLDWPAEYRRRFGDAREPVEVEP